MRAACTDLGIQMISYSPLGLGLVTGKYNVKAGKLPSGPRGYLFRQILPSLDDLILVLRRIAREREKTMPQVQKCALGGPLVNLLEDCKHVCFCQFTATDALSATC